MVVGDGDMTKDENAVHFGGWCIVSSPLILAFNLSDTVRHGLVWDIITNKEAGRYPSLATDNLLENIGGVPRSSSRGGGGTSSVFCRDGSLLLTRAGLMPSIVSQAIQVNQAWAGHPGSQVLHDIGNNSQVEVWTKPLGDGRTAVFIINTADKVSSFGGAASIASASAPSPPKPELRMNPCDATAKTQQWQLSPGVTPGHPRHTTISLPAKQAPHVAACSGSSCMPSAASPLMDRSVADAPSEMCISVGGCNEKDNARMGMGGCKSVPADTCPGKPCNCNGAFQINANNTITSVMDGQSKSPLANRESAREH